MDDGFKFKRSTQRLSLVLVLSSVILIFVGYLFVRYQSDKIKIDLTNQLSAIAQLKEEQIIKWRAERLSDANYLYNNTELKDYYIDLINNPSSVTVKNKIRNLLIPMIDNHDYKDIVILNKDGVKILSAINDSIISKNNLIDISRKARAMGKIDFSTLHKCKTHNNILITLFIPIRKRNNATGKPIGIAAIRINPYKELVPIINQWPLPFKTTKTILVEKENKKIIILNEFLDSKNKRKAEIPITKQSSSITVKSVQGSKGILEGSDYKGNEIIADVRPIPATNWYMITKIDEEEFYTLLKEQTIFIGLFILFVILSMGLGLFFIWQRQKTKYFKNKYELEREKITIQKKYDLLSSYANDAIILWDENLKIVEVNERAELIYGYTRKELLSLTPLDVRASTYPTTIDEIKERMRNSSGKLFETAHKKKSGSIFPVEVSSRSVEIEGRDYFHSVIRDISERKESERKLETLMNNLPGMAYRCLNDTNWTMKFVSSGSLELTGYSAKDLIDNNKIAYADLVYPEDEKRIRNIIETSLKNRSPFKLEYRIKCADDKEKWVWEKGTGVFNSEGKVTALEGFITDITEKISAQKILEESEIRFRSLYENLTIGVYRTTSDGNILMANPAFVKMLGYTSEEELINSTDMESVYADKNAREHFKERVNSMSSLKGFEHKLIRKDGSIIFIRESSRTIRDKNNRILYYEGTIEDITDRKIAELTLIEAKEKAEQSDKLKSDFLAQMSHEIRTPINVVLNFSNLIRDILSPAAFNEELEESLSVIDSAGKRIIRTIDSILNMSELQSGMYEYNPKEIDLYNDILLLSVKEFKYLADAKGLELKLINNTKETTITADEYSVSQIFNNLIDNAIKYTETGKVEISLSQKNKELIVEVSDTGVGISYEYLTNIFEPFSQEEHGYSRQYEGNGLGLALVKQYCDMNHAKISAKSKKNKGSTFEVKFSLNNN